ncbi:MAG: CoA transferase [Pseudomonadota bacterium]|nr:CoA transferase [Pseudomonadota bacterium]
MRDDLAAAPLAGITVLDFGQIFQGPYCTLLLAKAGADVIKVEPPHGDPLRRRAVAGKSAIFSFAMLNSNKRGITLNLKAERGRALLVEMVRRADVLVENFAPGTMDRLGVGCDVLAAINPRLIYATGWGYGISGPDRDNLAMDFTIQAQSGIMSVTGAPEGPPMKAGPTLVTEAHWQNLLRAMNREDLSDHPDFATNAARVVHMQETDALVGAWTRTMGKYEVFAAAKRHRIPSAAVREVAEVMSDPHMHQRGFLERFAHPEFGDVVLPTTPIRLHGTALPRTTASPTVGQHNIEVYGGWLGLTDAEISAMTREDVI